MKPEPDGAPEARPGQGQQAGERLLGVAAAAAHRVQRHGRLQPGVVLNNRLEPLHPDESHGLIGRWGDYATPVTLACAALLHDVVEDTTVSVEEISKRFSREIAEIVDGVTKLDKIKKSEVPDLIAATTETLAKQPAAYPTILATSSEKGIGIPELRATILSLA